MEVSPCWMGRRRAQAVSSLFWFGSRTAAINEFGKPLDIGFNKTELRKADAAERFKLKACGVKVSVSY